MSATNPPRPAQANAHPRGGWRLFGRIASAFTAAVALALVVAAIPAQLAAPDAVCSAAHSCVSGQLSPEAAATLRQYSISLHAYAIFSTVVATGSALVWFAAGGIVLLRRADDRVALLVGLQAFTQGASNASSYFTDPQSVWFYLAFTIGIMNQILLFYVFALFPSGHFVPRWMRWAAIIWIAMQPIGILPGWDWLSLPLFLAAMILLVGSQIYRYRRVSDPMQRQQTKLVVFAFATMVVVIVGVLVPGLFVPSLLNPGSLYTNLVGTVTTLVLMLGPISLVVAVLRYRLFDIDVIINRALVYGSLTLALALVYFASVVLLQQLVRTLTGQPQQNSLVVVLSTLLIAALFTPLRRRIQTTIDRRFYRRKYDAAKTLEAFAKTVRSQVDLADLNHHLIAVVAETMQPEHVSLWLHNPQKGAMR